MSVTKQQESVFNRLTAIFSDIITKTEEAGVDTAAEAAKEGLFIASCLSTGRIKFGPQYLKSLERPANYETLPPGEQWSVDKALGILDWSGRLDE